MTARPRISFVVPAYNEEVLLPACLRAIRAEVDRTGVEAEIIVVNNASTDRTAEVAIKEAGVILVQQPIKGLVMARSAGFEEAAGELVANIDADTLVPLGWLDKVLAEFDRDPDLVTVSGPYDYYDVPLHIRATARAFYGIGYMTYSFNRYVLPTRSTYRLNEYVM